MSLWWSSTGGRAGAFRAVAFRGLPLGALALAAAAGAVAGPGWSHRLAPLPWLVSLCVVGLPHGAADFAASRRAWNGGALAAVWIAYVAAMTAVAAVLALAPQAAILAFVAVSCWHFGAAEVDLDRRTFAPGWRTVSIVADGCAVLALPLAAWPAASAGVASDVAALAVGGDAARHLFPPAAVRLVGHVLVILAVAATALEGLSRRQRSGNPRDWLRLVGQRCVIASLGWFTDPLFAVGLFFLAWHGWRQMEPLAESLGSSPPRSWPTLGRALVLVHAAAIPLLVPAWVAVGSAWWFWSPDRTPRDLAITSIGAYLVVTPAHELLGAVLKRMPARLVDRWCEPPQADWASSRNTPMRRNFS